MSSDNVVKELTAINDIIVDFIQSNASEQTDKIIMKDATTPALLQILRKGVETMVSLHPPVRMKQR